MLLRLTAPSRRVIGQQPLSHPQAGRQVMRRSPTWNWQPAALVEIRWLCMAL